VYQNPGTYTVRVLELGQTVPLGTATVTVTGAGSTQPSATLPLLTFTSPQTGSQVLATQVVPIQWQYIDPTILQTFPNQNTYVQFAIVSSAGQSVGPTGVVAGVPLSSTSASWNMQANLNQRFYTLVSGAQYKLQATLQYQPTSWIMCDPAVKGECSPIYSSADQALIANARQYKSESGLFTVNMNGYARPTATINQGSALSGTAIGVSAVMLQVFSGPTTPPAPPVINTNVTIPVVNGTWSYAPPSSWPKGDYQINIWAPDGDTSLLSSTFTIQ
jgi:hypothetical protein